LYFKVNNQKNSASYILQKHQRLIWHIGEHPPVKY